MNDMLTGIIRDSKEVETPVSIRVATPLDGEGLRGMFSRSSSETIHRRFHTPFPQVPEWMLALMLSADRTDREFLVAVADGKVVGHAMYAMLGGGEAEMAIVIEDGWQSRGVGKALLRELAADAGRRGVETFVGSVLPDNRPMLGLIGAMFAGSKRAFDDGALLVRMPLQALADPRRPRSRRIRARLAIPRPIKERQGGARRETDKRTSQGRDSKVRSTDEMTTPQTPDLQTIKGRQQKAWSSGDYGKVGVTLLMMAEHLAEAADLQPGHRVLDVASGNGNAALAAARRFADVTALDYVPMLLEEGKNRAEAEGLPIDFVEGDAENLPFGDASFDVALSTLGVMFAPDQEKAAGELLRVVQARGHHRDGQLGARRLRG